MNQDETWKKKYEVVVTIYGIRAKKNSQIL